MNSTLESPPPAGPEADRPWQAAIEADFRGLLADIVKHARRAIDSLADELIRQREADRSKAIDSPAPVPVVNAQPKPVKPRQPRTPKPPRVLTVRPRECRLYCGKRPSGLSPVEREVVKALDEFGYMNRGELQRMTGCCYKAITPRPSISVAAALLNATLPIVNAFDSSNPCRLAWYARRMIDAALLTLSQGAKDEGRQQKADHNNDGRSNQQSIEGRSLLTLKREIPCDTNNRDRNGGDDYGRAQDDSQHDLDHT